MIRQLSALVLLVVTFPAGTDISGRIVRVLDGDTVEVLDTGNHLTRVRLAGIDAPEKSQPFGQRSRQELTSMVAQRSVIVRGCDTDRYGRLLGTVWLGTKDVNAAQIGVVSGKPPKFCISLGCCQFKCEWHPGSVSDAGTFGGSGLPQRKEDS